MSTSTTGPPEGWRSWTSGLVGRPCAGCRGPGGPLCRTCWAAFGGGARTVEVRPRPDGLTPVSAAADYSGPVREALVAFKDHGRWSLRVPLAAALGAAVAHVLLEVDARDPVRLVPVPGSPGSAHARDGDHVVELARRAAGVLRRQGLSARVSPVLVPARRRRDQVGLGRAERAANLSGSVVAQRWTGRELVPAATGSGRSRGPAVVLVDDLVTTGATLAECARALRAVGVEPVGAAVVAGVVRRP